MNHNHTQHTAPDRFGAFSYPEENVSLSPIEAAARAIYQNIEDQPWAAANNTEEVKYKEIAQAALTAAHEAAIESPVVLEYAANAISQSSGMRFDGFWMRTDELEPEDLTHALTEARAALIAAHTATRLIEVVREAGR